VVRYAYEIHGRTFESDRVHLTGGNTASFDRARDLAQEFLPEAASICLVDPAQPASAVLRRSPPWFALTVLLPLIFVVVGGGGLWGLWRRQRNREARRTRPISQLPARGRGRLALLFLGLLFTVVGTATFLPLFGLPMFRLGAASMWQAVPCRVVDSTLRSWSTDDGTSYRADVLYEYEADGRRWQSNRVDFFPLLSSDRSGARAIVDRFPANLSTRCWIDPNDPSRSVLDRSFRVRYLAGALTSIFLFAGLALMYSARRVRGRQDDASIAMTHPVSGPQVLRPKIGPIGKVLGALLFALFWNGIVSIFVWQAWKDWNRGDPDWFLTLFLVPFVLIGLVACGFVVHFLLASINPKPVVTLVDGPPTLGSELRLGWRFIGRSTRIRRLRIALEGREEATYRRGTDTVTDRETFAEWTVVDTDATWEIPRGSATIAIPDDTMHSFDGGNNKIIWELKVNGEIARWPDVDEALALTISPLPVREV
jgi:hypothetical protein